jgi:NADPH-dependent 2,4-dienoyl-CoA reductase/sulfur reductase-like enzyme
MKHAECDVAVIGAGPAGLAAAISAKKNGAANVLLIERGESLGGILNQCIHEGFGIHRFNETLTGPEYVQRFIDELHELKINYLLNSMVLDLSPEKKLIVSNSSGLHEIRAKSVILAMGCRERTRGQICIPGTRPAGVYTAGTAQYFMNLRGYKVGEKVVILGSGDIGLIMARRLTLEGAQVLAVAEIMPYSNGLPRNMAQCLHDFNVPLYLKHTVTQIHGKNRVEAVTIAEVDSRYKPVPGTEKKIECDTLLLSVGLIPENELTRKAGIAIDESMGSAAVDSDMETSVSGIFSCGNVLQVHDLVDYVSLEGEKAGKSAAEHIRNPTKKKEKIKTKPGMGVRYVLPQNLVKGEDARLSLRVLAPETKMRLIVAEKNRVIKKLNLQKVNPAEMIHINLKSKEIETAGEIEVRLENAK